MQDYNIFDFDSNIFKEQENAFIDSKLCVLGNVVSIEYLADYLSKRKILPTVKLNIHFNFPPPQAQPINLVSDYNKILQSVSYFGLLLEENSSLREDVDEINFTYSGLLCEGSIQWIGPDGTKLKYEPNINEHFSKMLLQIKHTNIKKLTINLCKGAIVSGLIPILSQTKLTHLKLIHFACNEKLAEQIINILSTSNLTHFICQTLSIPAEVIKDLCKVLPSTNLRKLYTGAIKGDTIDKIQAIQELCNILPFTKLEYLSIQSLGVFDHGLSTQVNSLFIKISETIPKTNLENFRIFGDPCFGLRSIIKNYDDLANQVNTLCASNLKRKKAVSEIWLKVFNNHVIKGTTKYLFSADISKKIITFLYARANHIINNLSEDLNRIHTILNIERSYKTRYLLEQYQLHIVKINNIIKANNAASIEHALRIAARKGDVNAVYVLLNKHVNPDILLRLHSCSELSNHVNLSNYVNIDINQPGDKSGRTALHQAVIGLTEKVIHNNYIIPVGYTDAEMVDNYEEEICSYENSVVVKAYSYCIDSLIGAGAIELPDKQGKLPTDYAVASDGVLKLLLFSFALKNKSYDYKNKENKESKPVCAKLSPN